MKKGYLLLENGMSFEGYLFGSEKNAIGELTFNTGMGGYIENLTDEGLYGHILLQTFPMIGNYGINKEDFEGKPLLFGYVAKEYCENPSNFRCETTLDDFLKEHGIAAICGIDTRQLTKIIRDNGNMNAMICATLPGTLDELKSFKITDALSYVSRKEVSVFKAEEEKCHAVLIDYGAKKSIIESLVERGCTVTAVPHTATADEILSYNPDGIVLAGGPGNPEEYTAETEVLKELSGKKPIFGISLGHNMLALAHGAKCEKLKYGHRGEGVTVKDAFSDKSYITSQNHAYTVVPGSIKCGEISFINVNDSSVEGIEYKEIDAFSVQFNPEGAPGPKDTEFLYDRFVSMIGGKN